MYTACRVKPDGTVLDPQQGPKGGIALKPGGIGLFGNVQNSRMALARGPEKCLFVMATAYEKTYHQPNFVFATILGLDGRPQPPENKEALAVRPWQSDNFGSLVIAPATRGKEPLQVAGQFQAAWNPAAAPLGRDFLIVFQAAPPISSRTADRRPGPVTTTCGECGYRPTEPAPTGTAG